jgi:E3 ubiquitin-protein ligase RGLG
MLEVLQAIVLFILFWVWLSWMGGSSSKESPRGGGSGRRYERSVSGSSSYSSAWDQSSYYQTPNHPSASPVSSYNSGRQTPKNLERKYSRIADNYRSIDEV